jgi:F-type H+-transporting ATPase subunit delta
MSEREKLYAEAFLAVLAAEGHINECQDELFRLAKIIEANDELRQSLTDPHLPVARRQQIIEDLLDGKAGKTTIGLVSMLIATGRIRELAEIVDHLLSLTAAAGNRVVAEVRSAVELDDDQKQRLAASLKAATGKDIDVVVVVDPSVLGGVVTQIGDTVIDGSVRARLSKLRESF